MRIEPIDSDILVFRGDFFESLATAFIRDGDVLLVDALASRADAGEMRRHLEDDLGKKVRVIVATHYMNDHMAGLRLFPDAQIIAHRFYQHTFLSQRGRTVEDDEDFVPPTTVFGDTLTLNWGRHTLHLFHNPGHTMSTIGIDVADRDLLFTGDNVLGNMAYVSSSAPALIAGAIDRLVRLPRRRIVPGHIGVLPGTAPRNALHYLGRLRDRVVAGGAIRDIAIEDCLVAGVEPTPFEREWHGKNLDVILERRLLTVQAW